MIRFLFFCCLSLTSALHINKACAGTLFTATYEGEYANLDITMERTLVSEGENFRLDSTAKSFMAKIHESSDFSLAGDILVPAHYRYERKIFGIRKNEYLDFDWRTRTVAYKKGSDVEGTLKLMAGALDPSLYQLQLQRDVAQATEQKLFSYQFVRRNRIKKYEFVRGPNTKFKLGPKEYVAIELTRSNDEQKQTRLWLIPDLDYAIAKIQHTEDGDTYQVVLTDYRSDASLKAFLAPNTVP